MKLKSGREVIEIQLDGYTEAVIKGDKSSAMTEAEWQEYGAWVLNESHRKLAEQRTERIKRNRESFKANPCKCRPNWQLNIDCPVHQASIRAAIGAFGL